MSRTVIPWPDRRLRMAAEPVDEINDDIQAIWEDMIAVMEAMPGVGLAATQLGITKRLAVVDASQERGQVIRMANPKVLHSSGKMNIHDEASPNLPGVSAKVSRPRAVTVAFTDAKGQKREQDFVGLWATSVQHQIDHLNGRMYFDRLSKVKRDMLLKRAKKISVQL